MHEWQTTMYVATIVTVWIYIDQIIYKDWQMMLGHI